MRSIPLAVTWETLTARRWVLVLSTLGLIAFPAWVLFALRHDGLNDMRHPSIVMVHIVMMCMCVMNIGAALFASQGPIKRMYVYPLRTTEIVAWRLLPAVVIMALQIVVCVATLNAMFGLQWPICGPALTAAAAWMAINAVVQLTERSTGWLIFGVLTVGAAIGLWFKSRYGSTFSDPSHYWGQVTASDLTVLGGIAATSYWVAVKAVARNRCGEPPISLGLIDWVNRAFDQSIAVDRCLDTAFRAQCWLEWRRKGWVMPTATLMLVPIGLTIWLFSSSSAEDLFFGVLVGGGVLAIVAFIGGLLFGNLGPNDSNYDMRSFTASRPLSDSDLARATLQTGFKSWLLTWSIWALTLAVVCGSLAVTGNFRAIKLPVDYHWWHFALTFVGPWVIAGTVMLLGLVGGSKRLLPLMTFGVFGFIVTIVTSKFALSPAAQIVLGRSAAAIFGVAIVAVEVWVFITARQKALITIPAVGATAAGWGAAMIVILFEGPPLADPLYLDLLWIAAFLLSIFLPVAAAPLAVAANRHR